MIPRQAVQTLRQMASYSPVVVVTGPRQTGKTTLTRQVFADRPYFNLEDPETREWAEADPKSLLRQCADGAIIDEAQRVPSLFSHLQVTVDAARRPGRFVLTGSSHFLLNASLSQSLAGRAAFLHLLPFSYAELAAADLAPSSLNEALYTGGYPPIYDRHAPPHQWYRDYIATYVERDVRQLLRVNELAAFQRFMALCAGYVGQAINYSKLGASLGISANTARAWLDVLEASYVVQRLQPHHQNFRKRLAKQARLYFVDTGLACRLLRIENAGVLERHPLRGALFENWVLSELRKARLNQGRDESLFFWRNQSGNEVDLIADQGTQLWPIECKSGSTLASDWFKGLHYWTKLAGAQSGAPHLVYGGERSLEREGVQVRSWRDLDGLLRVLSASNA